MPSQVEGATNLKEHLSKARSVYMETDRHACSVHGSKANDVNNLVPCFCEASPAVVHPSGVMQDAPQNGGLNQSKGVPGNKRHDQTAAINGTARAEKRTEGEPLSNADTRTRVDTQFESKYTDCQKSGIGLVGRRSNDAPAIVPIKKRRIQMAEVMRDPSPPPRSPSPEVGPPPPAFSSFKSASPPRSPSPTPCSPPSRTPPCGSPYPAPPGLPSPDSVSPRPMLQRSTSIGSELSDGDRGVTLTYSVCPPHVELEVEKGQGTVVDCLSEPQRSPSPGPCQIDGTHKAEGEEEAHASTKESPDVQDVDIDDELSEESTRETIRDSRQDARGEDIAVGRLPGVLSRTDTNHSADGRLHWDLNMEVEAWERQTEQAAGNLKEGCEKERPSISISADSDESKHGKTDDCEEDPMKVRVDEQPDIVRRIDIGHSICRDSDGSVPKQDEQMSAVLQGGSDWKASASADNLEFDNPASWEGEEASDFERSQMLEEHQDDANQATSSETKAPVWDQLPGEPEAEEHVDYGESDCDADDLGLEVDERTSLGLQADSDGKGEEAKGMLICKEDEAVSEVKEDEVLSDVCEMQEKTRLQEKDVKASFYDNSQLSEQTLEKHSKSRRTRSTGWDQLPEGFSSAEEALKASKEKYSFHGHGRPWAASRDIQMASGRGASRDPVDRRPEDGCDVGLKFLSPRDVNRRGRHPVRGGLAGGIRGRGGGPLGHWVSGLHRSSGYGSIGTANAAAVAAAKLKSSGFVVAPDGTITKAGNGIGPRRGGTQSGSRGGRGLFFPAMNFPHARALSTSFTASMKGGRSSGPIVGPGLAGAMAERGGLAGRRTIDRYRGPQFQSGGMELPHRSVHPLDQPSKNSSTSSFRPKSRVVRSRSKTPLPSPRSVPTASLQSQHSPPFSKCSTDRREADNFGHREFKHDLSLCRVPQERLPDAVCGSSFDWQVPAGAQHSPPVRGGFGSSLSVMGNSETNRTERNENDDDRITGIWSRSDAINSRDGGKERNARGIVTGRNRGREEDRRQDSNRLSTKVSGHKHVRTWGRDDVGRRKRQLL